MNFAVRFLLLGILLITVISVLGALVPDSFSTSIHNAIRYFLGFINYLSPIVHVSTIFLCMKILMNFLFGVATFYIGWFFFHILAG